VIFDIGGCVAGTVAESTGSGIGTTRAPASLLGPSPQATVRPVAASAWLYSPRGLFSPARLDGKFAAGHSADMSTGTLNDLILPLVVACVVSMIALAWVMSPGICGDLWASVAVAQR
jgi:hypothetical protein